MGKGSGVELGEKGEGAGSNRQVEGNNLWKGEGEVGNVGWREVRRGDGEVIGRSVELDSIGWGDAGWWEVGWGDGEVVKP